MIRRDVLGSILASSGASDWELEKPISLTWQKDGETPRRKAWVGGMLLGSHSQGHNVVCWNSEKHSDPVTDFVAGLGEL